MYAYSIQSHATIFLNSKTTVDHPPTITQVLLHQLLEKWGWDAFDEHVYKIRDFYLGQRDAILELTQKYLSGKIFHLYCALCQFL